MTKIIITQEITKCEDCPSIKHNSFIIKSNKLSRKSDYVAERTYYCKEDGRELEDRTTIPDDCPRLKEKK